VFEETQIEKLKSTIDELQRQKSMQVKEYKEVKLLQVGWMTGWMAFFHFWFAFVLAPPASHHGLADISLIGAESAAAREKGEGGGHRRAERQVH
jgi:hypothetical protein